MSELYKIFLENEAAIARYIARFRPASDDVSDLTQETFLRGFAAEMKGEIREPKAFLFKIAKNLALLDIKKNKRSPTDFIEDSGSSELLVDEGQLTADVMLDGRKKLTLLAKAVANLPPQCRRAFLLRRVDGLKYKQIANRMGISVSADEKHIAVGMVTCHAYLREQGYDPSEFGGPMARKPAPSEPKSQTAQKRLSDEQDRT